MAEQTHAFTVEQLGPRLFLTTFVGKISAEMAERAYETFLRIVETMHDPLWLSDATLITGFEPKTLALGARWFVAFKRRGGRYCLVASEWERSIMAARTMALGLGVRVRAYPSLALAKADAQLLLKEQA